MEYVDRRGAQCEKWDALPQKFGEDGLLASCYRSSLEVAAEHGCKTVAFSAISTGVYRFPLERAAAIAVGAVREFLSHSGLPETVTFVCLLPEVKAAFDRALQES